MKRVGVAVAGAVLSACLVGGASYGTLGSVIGGTVRKAASCSELSTRIGLLKGEKAVVDARGPTARGAVLQNRINTLQARFNAQCT